MGPAHSERKERRNRREGNHAGPNPAAGTLAPLATKFKDGCNSPPFKRKWSVLSRTCSHSLSFSFPSFPQSFWLQVSLNYNWIIFQILGDSFVRGISGDIAPIWWNQVYSNLMILSKLTKDWLNIWFSVHRRNLSLPVFLKNSATEYVCLHMYALLFYFLSNKILNLLILWSMCASLGIWTLAYVLATPDLGGPNSVGTIWTNFSKSILFLHAECTHHC